MASLVRLSAPERVYNLTVEGDHTYFVGAGDAWLWVHNSCGNEPELSPKQIADEDGVSIEHYYRSNDHPPAHAHVNGGGSKTRIGQNGKPLKGDPELSPTQQKVVDRNLPAIRRAIGKIGRWLDKN